MNKSLNTRPARVASISIALFVACLALPQPGFAQATGSHAGNVDHSGMHAATPVDLSDSEIDEAASVVSAESTTTVQVSNFDFTPATVTVPQGQTVRWEFPDPTAHTATDLTSMKLFDSGNKANGGFFAFVFKSAGVYPYRCDIHTSMQGKVQVPIKVAPTTGSMTTEYTITWSSALADPGFVFDVQIKRPGAAKFVNWKMGLTKRMVAFKPGAGPGKYAFRARLRKVDKGASLYSPFRTITVQ